MALNGPQIEAILRGRHPVLHRLDCDPADFEWIDASDTDNSVLVWLRKSDDGADPCTVICNLTPVPHHDHRVGAPTGGLWHKVLNTDAVRYGGSGMGNHGPVRAGDIACHGRGQSLTLPPLSAIVLMPGMDA